MKNIKFILFLKLIVLFVWMLPLTAGAEKLRLLSGKGKVQDDGLIECSGSIVFKNRLTVRLGPGDQVSAFFVRNGQQVKKGTPLVQLDNPGLREQYIRLREKLTAMEKTVHSAALVRTRISEANKSIQRIKARIEKEEEIKEKIQHYKIEEKVNAWIDKIKEKESNVRILEKELQILTFQKRANASLIDQIKLQLESTKNRIDSLLIKAPFDGKITGIPSYIRNMAQGSTVVDLYDNNFLEVKARAWQHHLPFIKTGSKVKVYPNHNHDKFVTGVISSVGLEGITEKNNGFAFFPVTIDLEASSMELKPGMGVMAKIEVEK